MKTVEVVGFKRKDLGTKFSKELRAEGNVPCVLYGADDHVHFYSPMYLFKDLVYSPEAHLVKLNVEGKEYDAILQDIQFHPVSEMMLHADFLHISEKNPVKIEIPVKLIGSSEGVKAGGVLTSKTRRLMVKALPSKLPDFIEIDVTDLGLGKLLKVKDLVPPAGVEILNSPNVTIVQVVVSRTARQDMAAAK